ncbi:hypothetical protein CEK27_004770 [Fusarium fujikuroi]|nr:hypothetical protein CEK27_004770 [Fusarium fujikuroi]QGI77987.1 hypothetical protein CEK25_004716 [Fusarium fujikuroi]
MATDMDHTASLDEILQAFVEAELSRYHELKDNTITLDQPRKRELKNQSDNVDGCANACLDVQIMLLDHIGNSPWTSLPESVQNVLSIKFPGSEYLVLKVQFGVEDLKALPVATPARPQAASAYVTPLSLELPPTGQHAQSPGTADRGSVKRKSAPLLSEALGSLPDLFKKPRLSSPEDDFVPSDDEAPVDLVDDDDAAAATAECLTPVVDDEGFIRIGPQPMKSQLWVQSAPEERSNRIIKEAVAHNHRRTDSCFPNSNADRLELAATKLARELSGLMIESKTGWVKLLCDYTGLPMSWAPGPRSPSLESIYPMVKFEGHIEYHAPPNGCLIMSFINWTKRQHPSIALSLVSVWLNAYQEPNFNSQRRQCAWAFNALSNMMIMTRAFQAMDTHENHIKRWDSRGVDEQRAILEMQRTGTRVPEAERFLEAASVDFLWAPADMRYPARLNFHGSSIYRNLKRIAESKGITTFEFEYYCTVLSPGRIRQRVFYPFHILSRPQAESIGWDWNMLFKLCREMLHTMRTACNKHAEKADRGEAHVDEVQLIYWMGTWVCDQINRLKAEKSDREEIAFSMMLDRWGLPIVPWKSHILRVSLCKKQDHGIAMIFGIEDTPDFDPVQHIDLSCATVTLDTSFTNMAMKNFDTGSWDSLRTILMQVPLHHPFWKVDLSLGDTVWAGEWDRSIQPQAPTPEFQANLLSIEAWVDEQPRDPFACAYCGQTFNSAGRLVEHSRRCSRGIEDEQEAPNLEQDNADQEYWDSTHKCDICNKSFTTARSLTRHKRTHTGDKPYKCDICGRSFTRAKGLKEHIKTHTGQKPHTCDVCGQSFARLDHLNGHKKTHTGEKPHKERTQGRSPISVTFAVGHSHSLKISGGIRQNYIGGPHRSQTPHHPNPKDWISYREGIVIPGETSTGSGSLVEVGLGEPVEVEAKIPVKTRITLKFSEDETQYPEPVHPAVPRTEGGYYWGYNVRRASSLSNVFTESPYENGYDVSIGTSERGVPASRVFPPSKRVNFNHLIIVFGGPRGLEFAAMNDQELSSMDIQGPRTKELFDHWVNVLPGQGCRNIRTDEAVFIALATLRGIWNSS